MKNSKAVVPTVPIVDAMKERQETSLFEYIIGKNRKIFFLLKPLNVLNLKILELHENNPNKYRDDDISLYES